MVNLSLCQTQTNRVGGFGGKTCQTQTNRVGGFSGKTCQTRTNRVSGLRSFSLARTSFTH